jgi:hypothetical protein
MGRYESSADTVSEILEDGGFTYVSLLPTSSVHQLVLPGRC